MMLSILLQAQDFIYEGPAKSEVRIFWSTAMGLQKTKEYDKVAALLEANLKKVKEKDPSYKTDKMEAEIAKVRSKAAGATTPQPDYSNLNPTQKTVMANQLLRKLFEEISIQVSSSTLPVMEFKFKDYRNLMDQYTALNTTPREQDIRRTKTVIEKQVYVTNQSITLMENSNAKSTGAEDAEGNYWLARYHQLYWEAVVKIFPEEQSFADEYKVISDFVNRNGSLENMKATMNKNLAEKTKNLRLPEAMVKDAALEKLVKDEFNRKYSAEFKGTALKVVLTQNGWTINRNELSGVVTSRHRTAKLVYKGNNGKCYLLPQYVIIEQQNTGGSSFGPSTVRYTGFSGEEMLCENVR